MVPQGTLEINPRNRPLSTTSEGVNNGVNEGVNQKFFGNSDYLSYIYVL